MFERFNEKAIKTIMLAQEEARRLGHAFLGTEMILLGLIGEGTAIPAKVLKSKGVNLKDARVEVEKIIGRGSGFVAVEIPFTPRASRVLQLSWDEARQLGHNYIGAEHLLLGVTREGEGVAMRVLENLGIDLVAVRSDVIKGLGEPGKPAVQEKDLDSLIDKAVLERTELARGIVKCLISKSKLTGTKEIELEVYKLVNKLVSTI